MGQYYYTMNVDKKQYLHPHKFDEGLKLMEFSMCRGGTMTALALLLAVGNGRGSGDARCSDPKHMIGSWAGDRIAVVGDYCEPDDVPGIDFKAIYAKLDEEWTDISGDMLEILRQNP